MLFCLFSGRVNAEQLAEILAIQDVVLSGESYFDTKLNSMEGQRPFLLAMSVNCFIKNAKVITTNSELDIHDVRCIHDVVSVGNTSYKIKSQLELVDKQTVLAEWEAINVLVNLTTRKPTPIPKHLKDEIEKHLPLNQPILQNRDLETGKMSTTPVVLITEKVEEQHVDSNNHANYLFYFMLVAKVSSEFLKEQNRKGAVSKSISYVRMWFKNESVLNDVLHIKLWEDEKTSDVIVHILNHTKGDSLINVARVESVPIGASKL